MDVLYIDMTINYSIDLDEREEIGKIRNILYDDNKFYILANSQDSKLGFFLL